MKLDPKVKKIHEQGSCIFDEETPGTYVIPYVVDLSCGCTKVTVQISYADLDNKHGNEDRDPHKMPMRAKCPNGHKVEE